jgi:unsaturated chondroitin disaccharide hydrolase
MIVIDYSLTPQQLLARISRMWELSAPKILAIERVCAPGEGAPVYTVQGK